MSPVTPISVRPAVQQPVTIASANKPQAYFSGQVPQANNADESRFINQRIGLNRSHLVESLLGRLDEAMTVAGESYSRQEAFTSYIDLNMGHSGLSNDARSGERAATVTTQVDVADNIKGKTGIMVLSSQARDFNDQGSNIAKARATFNAIDPDSVEANFGITQLLNRIPDVLTNLFGTINTAVEENNNVFDMVKAVVKAVVEQLQPPSRLAVKTVEPFESNDPQAEQWNTNIQDFYQKVKFQTNDDMTLKTGDDGRFIKRSFANPIDLASEAQSNPLRLVNTNVYVLNEWLNKKRTGHGGMAAANAVKDMEQLVNTITNKENTMNRHKATVTRVSAHYAAPFAVSDSLQFDTTIDGLDKDKGKVYLSSRVSKLDTKTGETQGPIIFVNGELSIRPDSPQTRAVADLLQKSGENNQGLAQAWAETKEN